MPLTPQVILIRIFAVELLLTDFTQGFETSFCCSGRGGGLSGEDLFGEDLGGKGREGGDTAFEIVAVPVGAHVSTLEVRGSEGDLAGITGVRVGFDCGLLWNGHRGASAGDGSHGESLLVNYVENTDLKNQR